MRVVREESRPSSNHRGKSARELLAMSVPPHSLEAERAVLGCLMRDHELFPKVAAIISTDSFYSDKHQKIWKAMVAIYDTGLFEIDVLCVGETLASEKQLSDVGGADALLEIYHEAMIVGHVIYYASLVRDKALLRKLIHTSTEILRAAYESSGPPDEILAEAEQKLSELGITGKADQEKQFLPTKTVVDQTLDIIQNRKLAPEGMGLSTGFSDLDQFINGLSPGKLYILAARPSLGKSALAGQIAEHVSIEEARWVQFVSLEMDQHELVERMLAGNARVKAKDLAKGTYDDREELTRLTQAAARISQSKLAIRRLTGATLSKVRSLTRRAVLKNECDLLIVDYLQLMKGAKFERREEVIAGISRGLKDLASELNIPVLALAQLNREVEKRETQKPRLSDLRESGAIEQDADVVMFLYRKTQHDIGLLVAKHRGGATGEVDLDFEREYVRFRNVAKIGAFNGF